MHLYLFVFLTLNILILCLTSFCSDQADIRLNHLLTYDLRCFQIAGTLKLELLGHDSMVTSVAFSKYGFLASTSFDKKVIVWKDGLNRRE